MLLCCPNKPPTIPPTNRRIAIIGEAPGKDDMQTGEPFSGYTGLRLTKILEIAGISRSTCFIGNISQVRPSEYSDNISILKWNGPEIQDGMNTLKEQLAVFKPHIVILLGNLPLKAALDPAYPHPLLPKVYRNKITNWRGSLFLCTNESSPFFGYKCLPAMHPAYCLRVFKHMPLLVMDIKKAVRHSITPDLVLPQRVMETNLTVPQILDRFARLRTLKKKVSLDIEGGVGSMSCVSFTDTPLGAFIVPFTRKDGSSYWSEDEELILWRNLPRFLEDPSVPKVLQNSLYDRFVFHFAYGIRVLGTVDDTMLKHWELYSELPKSLGLQTSIYTDEPFYKQERKSNDDQTFYEYCCKDSAVTLEINTTLDRYLTGSSLEHYRLNVNLLNPLLYMELRGIRYSVEAALARRVLLQQKLYEAQALLNALHGDCLDSRTKLTNTVYANLLYKKTPPSLTPPNWQAHSRKNSFEEVGRIVVLIQASNPSLATLGEVETLLGLGLNVGSNKQMCDFLYGTLALPQQFKDKKENEDEEDASDLDSDNEEISTRPVPEGKVETADYEALLNLSKHLAKCPNPLALTVVRLAIEIRSLATRQRMLGISADSDGRIRCGYNIVGSNTGRITCYESPTGSGYNLQTIPNYTDEKEAPGGVLGDRDLFTSDPDHWFFQCDLKGADGWTVAAYAALLGDRTMLDDYLFGLKPANIVTLMLRGVKVDYKDRAALKDASRLVEKDAWDYFACKRVQHGASYLEGPLTISRNVLKDSEGKCAMSVPECKQLSLLFFQRYWGVKKYHDYIASKLKNCKGTPYLLSASGQKRFFFGRPDEMLTKAVAHEPQCNTTYATNLAMYKLWTDLDNRNVRMELSNGETRLQTMRQPTHVFQPNNLRIEPLHQVHDALCGQFLKSDTSWAITKIQSYFDNPLTIAGMKLVIPFDGAYGISWGELGEKYGGGKI